MLAQARKLFTRIKGTIVLYVDRLDQVKKQYQDLPLIRSISTAFGDSVWFSTVLVYTHAYNTNAQNELDFNAFSTQRHQVVAQAVKAVVRDPRLQSPYSIVENHHTCPRNYNGDAVLPNNVVFKHSLLMQIVQYNILREAEEFISANTPKQPKGNNNNLNNNIFNLLNFGRHKLPPVSYLSTNLV